MRLRVRKVTTNIGQGERQLGLFTAVHFTLHIHLDILITVHARGDTGLRRGDGSVGRSRATSGYHLIDEDDSTFVASLPELWRAVEPLLNHVKLDTRHCMKLGRWMY